MQPNECFIQIHWNWYGRKICESISKRWQYSLVQILCFYITWRLRWHITKRSRCSHKWKVGRHLAQQTAGYKCHGIIRQLPSSSQRKVVCYYSWDRCWYIYFINFHMQMHQNSTSVHMCGTKISRERKRTKKCAQNDMERTICKQAAMETYNQIWCCCWKELLPENISQRTQKWLLSCAREQEKCTQILWNALALRSFFFRFYTQYSHNAGLFSWFPSLHFC